MEIEHAYKVPVIQEGPVRSRVEYVQDWEIDRPKRINPFNPAPDRGILRTHPAISPGSPATTVD